MEIFSKVIGFVIFIMALGGLYYLMKGKGRVLTTGSWRDLEQNFRVDSMPSVHVNTSAMIGSGRYRDTFKVALADEGVYMEIPALLKGNQKPVLIPYNEFILPDTNRTVSFGFFTYTQFIIRGQSVCLAPDIAKKIISRKNQPAPPLPS